MANYDYYNREERAICAHLFRLLHEKLKEKINSPLGQFLALLSKSNIKFMNGSSSFKNFNYENVAIYCEAAILRDAFENAKPNANDYMDSITKIVMKQHAIYADCKLFSQLDEQLNGKKRNGKYNTHPKQIKQKAEKLGIHLTPNENLVYQTIQEMFNAKPDLVITIDNLLLVCEAKHTQKFDTVQIARTENIAELWATLLYKDFGFIKPPVYAVFTLGANEDKFKPNITWADVLQITEKTYEYNDRTLLAIKAGADLLNRNKKLI